MTDTDAQAAPHETAIERLNTAFARAAAARDALDAAEDDVRALLREALTHGATWSEIEGISGKSAITVQHQYWQSTGAENESFDAFGVP